MACKSLVDIVLRRMDDSAGKKILRKMLDDSE